MSTTLQKVFHTVAAITTALIIFIAFIFSITASAEGTVTVSGNTSGGEGQVGWAFNREATTATSYTFSHDFAVLGVGSLYAGPITNTNFSGTLGNDPHSDKFVAEYFPGVLPVDQFHSFSYDYRIGQGGTVEDMRHFYVNIYANIDTNSDNYDCRYDYVAKTAATDSFAKVVVFEQDAPSSVSRSATARIPECPPTLELMPEGSHIKAFALQMGDVTEEDTGLDAYFDNVEIALVSGATTFNFEPKPRSKEDCANGGWKLYKFRNNGQCVKSLE